MKPKEYIMYDNEQDGIVVGIGTLKELAKIAETTSESLRCNNRSLHSGKTSFIRYEIIPLDELEEEQT